MKRKKLLALGVSVSLALMLVALLFAVACPSPEPAPEKTLQIGALMSLSGWFVVNDLGGWQAIQMSAEMINDQGGLTVNGQKYNIEMIVEDCKSTMDGVTAAANRLIFDKGVQFIIGPSAFFTSAATPVTEPAKVIVVPTWNCNTPGELDASTNYVFAVDGNVPAVIAATKFLRQAYPDAKNIALIVPDDGTGPFVEPIVRELLATEGINIVGDTIVYPNEMEDFSPIVAKINFLEGIDVIYQLVGVNPHVAAIAKGLRGGGNNLPYVTGLPTPVIEIALIAGMEAAEGVSSVCAAEGDPGNTPLMNELFNREKAKYGEDYIGRVAGANSLFILAEVIEAAQSLDPTVVKEKWESMDEIETIYGMGTVCGDKTFGINHHFVAHPQPIHRIQGGKVVPSGWIDVGTIP
jgi:branched-chain amino acid transport system substrate-binding protein